MPKSIPSGILVRQALLRDLPSLADLLVLTPDDGTLYQFPHILDYPEDMYQLHMGWLRPTLQDTSTLIRLAVLSVDEGEKVVGYSSWTKRESNPESTGGTRSVPLREANVAELNDSASDLPPPRASKALEPHKERSAAMKKVRERAPASLALITPCLELNGLATHPDHQGHGIGTLLVRWGIDEATRCNIPVFVTGEARGIDFYKNALGFRSISQTEYWLDKAGRELSREEVEGGDKSWEKTSGGVSGAQMVWLPKGYVLQVDGQS